MHGIKINSDEQLLLVALSYCKNRLDFKIIGSHGDYRLVVTRADTLMRQLAELYFDISMIEMNLTNGEKIIVKKLINKILADTRTQTPRATNVIDFPSRSSPAGSGAGNA